MGKFKYLVAAAIAATTFSGSANAAQTLVISGPSGVFTDDDVTCAAGVATPCSFTRNFTFVTPTGFNNVSLDISSILNGAGTDINFTSVLFNGVAFNTLATGIQEFRNLFNQSIVAGGSNTISIAGTTGGNAAFSGNLSFATVSAVPEPGTWGLMILGFGAAGYSLRRRRRDSLLLQAA